ncbi:unnamed protein product, partial [marine sediment metagenome]
PDPEFLVQSHSLDAFAITDQCIEYTFPKTWQAMEGIYYFEFWILVEDDCHYAFNCSQANRWDTTVIVGDYVDLIILNNDLNKNDFLEGQTLTADCNVTNDGTIDATDVPFTFSIYDKVIDIPVMDFLEDYEDLEDAETIGDWHWFWYQSDSQVKWWNITDFASSSPIKSFTNMIDATLAPPTGNEKQGIVTPMIDWWVGDPVKVDFKCKIMYNLDYMVDGGVYPTLECESTNKFAPFGLSTGTPVAGEFFWGNTGGAWD